MIETQNHIIEISQIEREVQVMISTKDFFVQRVLDQISQNGKKE